MNAHEWAILLLGVFAVVFELWLFTRERMPRGWFIGPLIDGDNRSPGMPETMSRDADGHLYFDFPQPGQHAGHVHYVTRAPDGITVDGPTLVMRYRIDATTGVQFIEQETGVPIGRIAAHLQRADDNWSARGKYAFYRWYSLERPELTPGEHEMRVLPDGWGAVMGGTSIERRREFIDTLNHIDRIGFTFGGNSSAGHGVYATGPARFTLLDFWFE